MELKDLTELKSKVERIRRDADRAQGAYDQAKARLKSEYDCDSLEEAQAQLKKLEKQGQEARETFDADLAAFEEKWRGKLDE